MLGATDPQMRIPPSQSLPRAGSMVNHPLPRIGPWQGQLEQFELERLERLEGLLLIARPGAGIGSQGSDVLVDLLQLRLDAVVDGGEEGPVGQAGIVEPDCVCTS